MATSDGAIILSVEIDKSSMNNALSGLSSTSGGVNTLNTAMRTATISLKKFASALGTAFSVAQLVKFSKEASELASQTEAYLTRLGTLYGSAAQGVYDWVNANSYALGMSKSTAYEAAAQYGNLFTTFASATESAELSIEMLQATAVVASQTGRTYEETFEKMQSGIYGNTRSIDDLGISVRQSSLMQTKAWQTVSQNGTKSWNDLTDAELQQLRVLGIIEQANEKYGNEVMQTTALARAQFDSAWKDFKATWGQAVNVILVPTIKALTKILNLITLGMQAIANLFGKNVETKTIESNVNEIETETDNISDNIDSAKDNQEALNKELKKTLAGFDELEILSNNISEDSSGLSDSSGGLSTEITTIGDNNDDGILKTESDEATATLEELTGVISGALTAVGIILLMLGSISWGVGFIIAGATLFGVTTASLTTKIDTKSMAKSLKNLEKGIALALCAVGLILLFTGNIGWGAGFLIAGAYLYAVAKQNADGTDIDENSKTRIQQVEDIVGNVLIAIGLILLFAGQIGFAIGFIIVGATLHDVSEQEQGETDVDVTLKEKLEDVMKVVGESLIAIGLIMIFLGQITWGLGYIAAGAGLFSASEIIPSESADDIKENCDAIISFLSSLTTYLVTKKLLQNWKSFVDKWGDFKALCELIEENGIGDTIKKLFGDSVSDIQLWAIAIAVVVGSISYLAQNWDKLTPAQRTITILSGLATAATAAAIAIALFHTSWSVGLAAAAIAGGLAILGATFLFKKYNTDTGAITNASGEAAQDISQYSYLAKGTNGSTYDLPKLAKGAVIPPNHEFVAVLGDQTSGTNIEAPAKLIKQMVNEALDERGIDTATQQVVKEEHYYIDNTELMNVIYKLAKGGEKLNGRSLASWG